MYVYNMDSLKTCQQTQVSTNCTNSIFKFWALIFGDFVKNWSINVQSNKLKIVFVFEGCKEIP